MSAIISAQLASWPPMDEMAAILRDAGLRVSVGGYSIRIEDCSHFVFQEYGADLGTPRIDADAETKEEMMRDGQLVSDALSHAGIAHRFEVYDETDEMVGYLHHDWPVEKKVEPASGGNA